MSSVPKGTHFVGSNPFLQRVYALQTDDAEGAKALYDEWASAYDKDLAAEDYASPDAAVDAVIKHLPQASSNQGLEILDAGCGTGLVGLCLAKSKLGGSGMRVDGLDMSPGMLEIAKKTGVYRDLEMSDLTKPIEKGDCSYDVVTCVGTLTQGHVGPKVFGELVRVAKKGGLVVATVLDDIWVSGGYKDEIEGLEKEGKVEILSTDEFGIRRDAKQGGRMVALKKS